MITGDALMILGQACTVARGARFYIENFDVEDVPGGNLAFAAACFGLIGFALDAVNAHFVALDEQQEFPRWIERMELSPDFSGRRPLKGEFTA